MADRCEEKVAGVQHLHYQNDAYYSFLEAKTGILRAATQYGVRQRILDLCTFDITRNPWRYGGLFDAIITDPPCKR